MPLYTVNTSPNLSDSSTITGSSRPPSAVSRPNLHRRPNVVLGGRREGRRRGAEACGLPLQLLRRRYSPHSPRRRSLQAPFPARYFVRAPDHLLLFPFPSANPNTISSRRFAELTDFDPKFARHLYLNPDKYLPYLKDAAQMAQVSEHLSVRPPPASPSPFHTLF